MFGLSSVDWTALGTIIGFLSLLCAIYSIAVIRNRNNSDYSLFFCDAEGLPRTDVFLLFPDGLRLEPNLDGIVTLPKNRVGEVASVRDLVTRREIRTIITPKPRTKASSIHL